MDQRLYSSLLARFWLPSLAAVSVAAIFLPRGPVQGSVGAFLFVAVVLTELVSVYETSAFRKAIAASQPSLLHDLALEGSLGWRHTWHIADPKSFDEPELQERARRVRALSVWFPAGLTFVLVLFVVVSAVRR